MDRSLKYTATADINAPTDKVWKALTDPEMISRYFYGTNVETAWKPGSPIIFRGEWEGKAYIEKGEILEIDEGHSVSYSYLTTGLEDKPENYAVITYEVEEQPNGSRLLITQEGYRNREAYEHSSGAWQNIINGLKALVE